MSGSDVGTTLSVHPPPLPRLCRQLRSSFCNHRAHCLSHREDRVCGRGTGYWHQNHTPGTRQTASGRKAAGQGTHLHMYRPPRPFIVDPKSSLHPSWSGTGPQIQVQSRAAPRRMAPQPTVRASAVSPVALRLRHWRLLCPPWSPCRPLARACWTAVDCPAILPCPCFCEGCEEWPR